MRRSCSGRLIRSLPTRRAVIGVATCDKGLPAMMMALAALPRSPAVPVPGGVTLPPTDGEDAGNGADDRRALRVRTDVTLEEAAELGCRACASPGGGCQFLGTAATSQVVAEALGLTVPHAALAPSGQPIWTRRGAALGARGGRPVSRAASPCATSSPTRAIRNAMAVHAAFGGSTNLLLHIPAIAHAAGLRRPGRRLARPSIARCRASSTSLPNGPASDGPRLPRRRRAGGDAAPAARGPAGLDALTVTGERARRGARLVGSVGSPDRASRPA